MEKILLFTRKHWRKLVIASIPVIYGITYVKNAHSTYEHMRNVCNIVNQCPSLHHNKVLVVLNPAANKKKSENMFKKYCEPVLHMAGYEVDVIKTEHIGHAKSLMESLQQLPDLVVVAGGDGISSEVVTGLFRKNKDVCPILFLPLGAKNDIAFGLMESKNKMESTADFIKNLSQCMLSLVQGRINHRPLIKYELIENNNPITSKPIYGVHSFSWGILTNIEINKEKYWYFGMLNHYASVIIASLSEQLNQNISADIVSTPPCPGCNKCEIVVKNKSRLNISKLLNTHTFSQPTHQLKEYKLCSTKKHLNMNAKQIYITCKQDTDLYFFLKTRIIENIISRSEFSINMMRKNKIKPYTSHESNTIEIIPTKSDQQTYYIDGESYDARHIKISLLPNALKYIS